MMGLVGVAGPPSASAAACPERTAPSLIAGWGSLGSLPGQFRTPIYIAVNAFRGDLVYVTDYGNDRVQKFSRTGRFISQWGRRGSGDGQFHRLGGIAISRPGGGGGGPWLYVADGFNRRIQKFSELGTFIRKWDVENPSSIAVDSRGYVYVVDGVRVQKFSSTGRFIRRWGRFSFERRPGEFHHPLGIAIDALNRVYVVDWHAETPRIQKFTSEGAFVTQWATGGPGGVGRGPWGIAAGRGVVYVTHGRGDRVQKFDLSGRLLVEWTESGPFGISVDSEQNVYVVKEFTNQVQRLGCAPSPSPGPGGGPF
jgi:DNA-binding beta-propeller fold protein YncE